jgi:hypothetical protein
MPTRRVGGGDQQILAHVGTGEVVHWQVIRLEKQLHPAPVGDGYMVDEYAHPAGRILDPDATLDAITRGCYGGRGSPRTQLLIWSYSLTTLTWTRSV